MFIIEKNIPIPEQAMVNRKIKYPFADMEIGDSFFDRKVVWQTLEQKLCAAR